MARAARCDSCGVRATLLIWGPGQSERKDAEPGTLSAYICQGCGGVVTLRAPLERPEPKQPASSLST